MIRRENTIMAVEKAKFNNVCENFMDKVLDIYDVPGVQVGVSVGDVSYTAARGYRNFFTKDPLKDTDVFHCASVSKMFTAMGIMKLVDQKKIDLNDRMVDLLPFLKMQDERSKM